LAEFSAAKLPQKQPEVVPLKFTPAHRRLVGVAVPLRELAQRLPVIALRVHRGVLFVG